MTHGPTAVAMAASMGVELMPWQVNVLQEALKVKPDGSPVYKRVGIMCSRQQGKSALMRQTILHSMFIHGQSWISMAQNRKLAKDQLDMAAEAAAKVPWMKAEIQTHRRANGDEMLLLKNGARWVIAAATQEGPRGMTGNLWVDELREISPAAWTAAAPVIRAVKHGQIWVTSNAGDMHSTVLNDFRQRALSGVDPSMLWMEWSSDPTLRLDDPKALVQCTPALGHTMTYEGLISDMATSSHDAVMTEIHCRYVDALDSPWPPGSFDRCLDDTLALGPGPVTWLAVDVTPDRKRADLVGAQLLDDGRIAIGLIESWISDTAVDEMKIAGDVAKWARTYHARIVAYDKWAASSIAARLASVGIPVSDTSGAVFAQACDETLAAMNTGRLAHAGQQELTNQVMACAKKPAADGGWRIIRRESRTAISAAVAMVMVVHHANAPQKVADIMVA